MDSTYQSTQDPSLEQKCLEEGQTEPFRYQEASEFQLTASNTFLAASFA